MSFLYKLAPAAACHPLKQTKQRVRDKVSVVHYNDLLPTPHQPQQATSIITTDIHCPLTFQSTAGELDVLSTPETEFALQTILCPA